MFNKSIAIAITLAVAFGFTQASSAAEETAAPATVIIYRADESVKTKRINVGITSDASQVGRLSANKRVIAQSPAGEYTLGTSVPGTEPLTLDLESGATYYVHAQLSMRGSRVQVTLNEVAEQVALVHQPALDAAI
jgi:hypothetical protein